MSCYNRSRPRDGVFLALSWLETSTDYFNHCKTHFKNIQSVPPTLSFRRKSKQYTFCKTVRLTYDCPNIGNLVYYSSTQRKAIQELIEEHHTAARRSHGSRGKTLDHLHQNNSSERLQSLLNRKDGPWTLL